MRKVRTPPSLRATSPFGEDATSHPPLRGRCPQGGGEIALNLGRQTQ
jgi:hypothetical protein